MDMVACTAVPECACVPPCGGSQCAWGCCPRQLASSGTSAV